MTIVLQHQYWDLIITEDFFEVTVSFNKQQERIKVPFAALSAFVDPSVRFGLQFDRKDKGTVPAEKPAAAPASATPLPAPEKRPPPDAAPGEARPTPTRPKAGKRRRSGRDAESKPEGSRALQDRQARQLPKES